MKTLEQKKKILKDFLRNYEKRKVINKDFVLVLHQIIAEIDAEIINLDFEDIKLGLDKGD